MAGQTEGPDSSSTTELKTLHDLLLDIRDRLDRMEGRPISTEWLSIPEAAKILGMHDQTLRRKVMAEAEEHGDPNEFTLSDGIYCRRFGERYKLRANHCIDRAFRI